MVFRARSAQQRSNWVIPRERHSVRRLDSKALTRVRFTFFVLRGGEGERGRPLFPFLLHSARHRMVHFEFGQDWLTQPHPLNTFGWAQGAIEVPFELQLHHVPWNATERVGGPEDSM